MDGSTIGLDRGLLLADPSRSQGMQRLAQRAVLVRPLCVPRPRALARGVQPLARALQVQRNAHDRGSNAKASGALPRKGEVHARMEKAPRGTTSQFIYRRRALRK